MLLLTAEDDIEDTIIPRLVAAGADLERVEIVRMVRHAEGKRMFSLVTDLALLRQKIDEVGDVVMIVIDPISAYLGVGKIDSYRVSLWHPRWTAIGRPSSLGLLDRRESSDLLPTFEVHGAVRVIRCEGAQILLPEWAPASSACTR